MKTLYEIAIADMTSLLEKTVEEFSMAHEISPMEPLFCVSNNKLPLMTNVAYFSNYQVLRGCRQLCIDMCKKMKLNVIETQNKGDIDFIVGLEDETVGVLVSITPNFFPEVAEETMNSIKRLFVVVLKESTEEKPIFYPPANKQYREYRHKELVKNITIKQFFELLGRTDYEDFKECVGRYNYDAEQLMGITISAIPTQKAIEKHKSKIENDLLSCFYAEELRSIFKEEEISEMRKWVQQKYAVLISDADFSRSFISSEWYYSLQIMTDVGLEQTAIVAGYLKSLEQLLCSILLVISENEGKEFMFYTNKDGQKATGQNKLPLTRANQKLVLTMAKNILRVVKGNKKSVLRKTEMTDRVIEYLEQYVEKTRNGYMHKDNIYEWDEIKRIRTKTYAAYFMILGTFFIDVEQLSHIND